MPEYDITSPANERIKRLVRLRQRRHRDDEGVFIVEGPRLVQRAIESGHEPVEIHVDGSGAFSHPEAITVEPSVLDRASYRQSSQGVIAVFRQFPTDLDDISPTDPALLLATEALEKPGNLGAMLRTAAAVGCDGMIATDPIVDVFNPNVVRASTGAIFTVPIATSDLKSFESWLDRHSIALIATSPEAGESIWEADLSGSCALMVGAEDIGLSPEALERADRVVRIPMSTSGIDSLNASVSAAVIAYEALRQRS